MNIMISLLILATIISWIALIFAIIATIEVKALKNSTHKVQFMPAEEFLPSKQPNPELEKMFKAEDDGFIDYENL